MHATTTRTSRPTFVRALLGALTAAAAVMAAGPAQASPDDLQRVEISGRRPGEMPRTDVRATCPGVDVALAERLNRAQYMEGIEGMATVSFRLTGNTITEVHQNRGPYIYAPVVRRAVRALKCEGPQRDTLFVMQIAFRNQPSDGSDMTGRIALLEMAPTSAGSASAAMGDGR